tara:strand:- start:329 stop:784 length:456 start_codon:yes stop_codon:yes gene_type:complete
MPITNAKRSFCILSNKQFEKEFPSLITNTNTTYSKQNKNNILWSDIIQNKTVVPSVSYDIKGLKDLPMKYNDDIAYKVISHPVIYSDNNLDIVGGNEHIDYIEYDMTYSNKFYLGCDDYDIISTSTNDDTEDFDNLSYTDTLSDVDTLSDF